MRHIWAGLLIVASSYVSNALNFPGLISKNYEYSSELNIKTSYYLTAKNKSSIVKNLKRYARGKKTWDQVLSQTFAPRFPFHESFQMCPPKPD